MPAVGHRHDRALSAEQADVMRIDPNSMLSDELKTGPEGGAQRIDPMAGVPDEMKEGSGVMRPEPSVSLRDTLKTEPDSAPAPKEAAVEPEAVGPVSTNGNSLRMRAAPNPFAGMHP